MARSADTYRGARRNAYRAAHVLPVWRAEQYAQRQRGTNEHPSLHRALAGVDVTGDLRRVKRD